MSEMRCTLLAENTGRTKSPFWHHRTILSGYIFGAKLCGVEQRAPPIFGRATITLGIGLHSSVDQLSAALLSWCHVTLSYCVYKEGQARNIRIHLNSTTSKISACQSHSDILMLSILCRLSVWNLARDHNGSGETW